MADQAETGDQQLDKASDSKADSKVAAAEAQYGMKAMADETKNYYQARKDGLRDTDTSEIFGDQPMFYDSAKEKVAEKPADGGKGDDSNKGLWDRAKESLSDLGKDLSPEMALNKSGAKLDGQGDAAKDKAAKPGDAKAPSTDELTKDLDKLPATPEQKAQFKKDMAEIDKLPKEQRDKIHASLDKIMQGDASATKLDENQRVAIATSLAHQIAHPEDIKQANKDTCVGANAEKLMAREHPETYADMVAKLSTEGKYTAPGGKEIQANIVSGKIQTDTSTPDGASKRSQASDVFQCGAMNLGLEGRTYKSYKGQQPHESETDANGKESRFTGLDAGAKEKILNQLTGDNYKARPINSPSDLEKAFKDNGDKPMNVTITQGEEGAKFSGMDRNDGKILSDEDAAARARRLGQAIENGTIYYNKEDLAKMEDQLKGLNPEELKQVEEAFKKDDKVNPKHMELKDFIKEKMNAAIMDKEDDATKQRLQDMLNVERDPSKGPTHAVTITKIENGKVYYENTADSKGKDHSYPNGEGVPIEEFTKAMKARKGTASVKEPKA